jgi:16S rRNA (adenine1518-N6/adenine1519-N6)-dimethyltransferase
MLEERGLRPKRSLGQNFLIDHNLLRRLVDAAAVGAGDTVLEVGPGTGTLTEELLARGCRVVACELDDGLAALLRDRASTLHGGERLTVVHGDCLASKRALAPEVLQALGNAATTGFALVANLPYGAATPLLSTLLVHHLACRTMAITVQRELGDRLTARPRTKEYGALSVLAQALCECQRIAVLPPQCFWPRPDVTSIMVVLRRRAAPLTQDAARLSSFCARLFTGRRKQLGSVLGRDTPWPAGVEARMRAEELTVPQIIALGAACELPSHRPDEIQKPTPIESAHRQPGPSRLR